MNVVEQITGMIEPSLSAMGYRLVQVKYADGARRKSLIIMAERADDTAMGFDDCTEISRTVSALLEVEDPIAGAYNLEVCSPGLDRPLVNLEDFKRYQGDEAKVETLIPQDGRKRFRGVIEGVKNEMISLLTPEGAVLIAHHNIRSAKLSPALVAGSGKKGQGSKKQDKQKNKQVNKQLD
jgi:ribosome maturation factor RimP